MRLGDIAPNPRNPKRHPDRQRRVMEGILAEVGWTGVPLAYHSERAGGKLVLVDGHLRQTIAPDAEVEVAITDLTDAEADYLLLTYDPVASLAEQAREATEALLRDVQARQEAVAEMLAERAEAVGVALDEEAADDPGPQVDRAEELREKWGTERGQIWEIPSMATPGQVHRVMCGDSTKSTEVEWLTHGEWDTVVFDPPWDAGYSPRMFSSNVTLVFGDASTIGMTITDMGSPPTWLFVWDCVSSWYVPNRPLRRCKLCAWWGNVDSYDPNGAHYGAPGEERVVQNPRGKYVYRPDPRGKRLSDVFVSPITRLHSTGWHNHEKPATWVAMLIANTSPGRIIFDPFLGSGTTIVACEQTGRIGYGMEIDPAYCAVTLERLAGMGLEPRLVGS